MKEIALNLKSMQDYRINESYKQLRTNIEFSGEENKIIAVTSCTCLLYTSPSPRD